MRPAATGKARRDCSFGRSASLRASVRTIAVTSPMKTPAYAAVLNAAIGDRRSTMPESEKRQQLSQEQAEMFHAACRGVQPGLVLKRIDPETTRLVKERMQVRVHPEGGLLL